MKKNKVNIPVHQVLLKGDIAMPDRPKGLIIFSHGSGSSRLSPRNRFVAEFLQKNGFATLLFDLLTESEDKVYERRFDIELLSQRLVTATHWIKDHPDYKRWNTGYFGASTGAASALKAAVALGPEIVKAVVSRGGRPDLASEVLEFVECPVLLLVGEEDKSVLRLNKDAYEQLACDKQLITIPGATHLFEEPGKLEKVTEHAYDWFEEYLYRSQIEIDKDFMG